MGRMGSPDWERLCQRLTEHRQAGRVARAEELLRSWGGTLPYQPWVWAELGDILLERGDLPGAGRVWHSGRMLWGWLVRLFG